jgi:hypothetical protein
MVKPPRRSAKRVVSHAASLAETVADHSTGPNGRAEPAEIADNFDRPSLPERGRRDLAGSVARTRVTVIAGARCVAFWLAIVLPFITLPFLASGITTTSEVTVVVVLLVANVLALVVGRNHRRP